MTDAAKFGFLVRKFRKDRKLGLSELAEQARTGTKHLGRIERGEKQPSFELIIDLAIALRVSPAALFEFETLSSDTQKLKAEIGRIVNEYRPEDLVKGIKILRALRF
jgi:transcriptional regulator with XRE-family HTH domain